MSPETTNGSAELHLEVLRRVIEEGFNKGNYPALDALYAHDMRNEFAELFRPVLRVAR